MADGENLEWLSDYMLHALKSPSWAVPIAQFVDDKCAVFDDCEENKLEYTILHREFRELIDSLLLMHIVDVSVTPAQFESFCQNGLGPGQELHRVFVEQVLSVDDFLTFKAMMVKRNAALDMQANMELDMNGGVAGHIAAVGPAGSQAPAEEFALVLAHSPGNIEFLQWPLAEGVVAWHDRDFTYTGVPDEMVGATLCAGEYKDTPTGYLQFVATTAVTLYVFHENSGKKRTGGFPKKFKNSPEWVEVGGTQMQWNTGHGQSYWMKVWSRKVEAGVTVDMEILEEFVGGVAARYDDCSWRQYEEQEQQVTSGQSYDHTGAAVCAPASPSAATTEAVSKADLIQEAAEIEKAIALSIKAEEERVRLIAAQAAAAQPVEDPAAAMAAASAAAAAEAEAAAAASAAAQAQAAAEADAWNAAAEQAEAHAQAAAEAQAQAAAQAAAEAEALAAATVAAAAEAEAVAAAAAVAMAPPPPPPPPPVAAAEEVPAAEETPPVSAPQVEETVVVHDQKSAQAEVLPAPTACPVDPSRPAVPRMVKLQPLGSAPAALPPVVGHASQAAVAESAGALDRMRVDALLTRECDKVKGAAQARHEQAAPIRPAAAEPPPAPAPSGPAGPPTDEERRLRQEHLRKQRDLLVAKRAAERQGQLQAYKDRGGGGRAIDSAINSAAGAAPAEPTPADTLAANPDGEEAAIKMRQALTLQLRQSLMQ